MDYTPIKALNTMNPDWKIKVRVIKKRDKKYWKNDRGEGVLMNIDLMDAYGDQIQATFFKSAVDYFESRIEENKVYLFSNGIIKMANTKFSSIKNEYSLTFNKDAEIIEVNDDGTIKSQSYSFTSLKALNQKTSNNKDQITIDFIGIIIDEGEEVEINLKSGGTKTKRNITLADNSSEPGYAIEVALWGEQGKTFKGTKG